MPSPALADEPTRTSADGAGSYAWGVGIAALSEQKAYAGIKRDNLALPVLFFENSWVRVLGPRAEVKLHRVALGASQSLDFRLLLRYDESGYEQGDAPILSGMAERKGGFWAGAKATWRNDLADVSVELLGDASGHSKGQRAALSLERSFRLGEHVTLAPRLAATWLSQKDVDYYYGVRGNEVTASRAAHVGASAVNAELGARATYRLDTRQSVFMDVGLTRLAREIKDSPLVDRSTENRVLAGYLYRFR